MRFLILFLLSIALFSWGALSPVQINLEDLDNDTRNRVINLLKKKEKEKAKATKIPVLTPQKVDEWKNIAVGLGQALNALCKELSVNINEFAKTPVGILTFGMLGWKIIGKDIAGIAIRGCLFLLLLFVFWRSFRYFHMSERVLVTGAEGFFYRIKRMFQGVDPNAPKKEIEYVKRNVFRDTDYAIASGICHVIVATILMVCALVFVCR